MLAVVDGQMLEPRIGGLDEDLRLVAGGAQHALDAEHLVADGVAVAERREDLVDARREAARAHADCERSSAESRPGMTAPDGILARTSAAAGRSRRRRANQPGSGSIVRAWPPASSRVSRSNMSRYFRSITGHA